MPTENKIDCPALHKRSDSYPFGDRVPRTVRMLSTVTADPMPGIGLAYIKGKPPVAKTGQTYQVWTNSHGAVTAIMEDGTRLGLRPAEFEVESWHNLAAEPSPQPHPEPIAWMVGTAFWWTKEEAERDAAATGLPIVGLGPMTCAAPAEQHQGEPVFILAEPIAPWFYFADCADPDYSGLFNHESEALTQVNDHGGQVVKLWNVPPCADRGEVERCEARLHEVASYCATVEQERDALRAQLAKRDALPQFAQTVIRKLKRFRDCAEDGQGADIGKTWFDVLVQLGLLNRVQRSPAWWEITDEGDALLDGRAALSASAEPSAPTSQTINGHRLFCKAVDEYKPSKCSCGAEPETKS